VVQSVYQLVGSRCKNEGVAIAGKVQPSPAQLTPLKADCRRSQPCLACEDPWRVPLPLPASPRHSLSADPLLPNPRPFLCASPPSKFFQLFAGVAAPVLCRARDSASPPPSTTLPPPSIIPLLWYYSHSFLQNFNSPLLSHYSIVLFSAGFRSYLLQYPSLPRISRILDPLFRLETTIHNTHQPRLLPYHSHTFRIFRLHFLTGRTCCITII
jgi:hypothetical protein